MTDDLDPQLVADVVAVLAVAPVDVIDRMDCDALVAGFEAGFETGTRAMVEIITRRRARLAAGTDNEAKLRALVSHELQPDEGPTFTPLSRPFPEATALLVAIIERDKDLKEGRKPRAIPELEINGDDVLRDRRDELLYAALDLVRARDRQIALRDAMLARRHREGDAR